MSYISARPSGATTPSTFGRAALGTKSHAKTLNRCCGGPQGLQETAHMNATEAGVKADSQCESTVLRASIRQGIDPLFELHFASMIKRKNNEPVKGFGKV
jgi:hypothetical protein